MARVPDARGQGADAPSAGAGPGASPALTEPRAGLKFPQQGTTVAELRDVWRIADEGGWDHLWLFDHFVPILEGAGDDIYEAWSLLAAMAEATHRVRIGIMVSGNTFRHPGVVAKMAATIDHLCAGRLEFGLGAAWNEREHRMFGIELGTPGRRIDRMREALILLRSLWTQPSTSFEGAHYRLQDATCAPKPLQRPHPPIWIGGTGERKTLRVVAEMADAWNAFRVSPEEGGRLSQVLDRHCADLGRDPAEIRRTIQVGLNLEDPAATVNEIEAFFARGFSEAIVSIRAPEAARAARMATEMVLPALRQATSR